MGKDKQLTKQQQHWRSIPLEKRIKFILKLSFIAGITLREGEELGLVDMSGIPENVIADGSLSELDSFGLVFDEEKEIIELRDPNGFKVLSFDVDEDADLSIFPNLVDKKEYSVTHNMYSAEPKIIGENLYRVIINEKENKIESLKQIDENADDAFTYKITSQEQMISLVNAICGEKYELLHSESNDKSQATLYDVEQGKYITGDFRSTLAETFEQLGMDQQIIDAILNGHKKELEETDEESFDIGNGDIEDDVEVLDESVLDTCVKQSDGSLVVEDQKQFKKEGNILNILTFLQYKVTNYKQFSKTLGQDDLVEFIKETVASESMSDKEMMKSLSKLYSFIIMRESGSGNKILHRVNQEINDKVKAYVEEHNITEYKGRNISRLSNEELLQMLEDNANAAVEEAAKEADMQDEGQAKYDKQEKFLYSHSKVSSKEQLTLQAYYDDQVKKHADRYDELLDEAVKTEDLKKELQIKLLYQEFADAIKKQQRYEAIGKSNEEVAMETSMSNLSKIASLLNADRSKINDACEDMMIAQEEQEQEEQEEDSDVKIYIPEREREENQVKISASAFYEADTDNLGNLTNDVPEIGEQIRYEEQEQEDEEENTIEGIDTADFYEM